MSTERILTAIFIIWMYAYIIYSVKNTECLTNNRKYFFLTPRYIQEKFKFNILIVYLIFIVSLFISPLYYLSLLLMIISRKFVDYRYWKKYFKELEELEKTNNKSDNKKKIKRLN